MTIPSSREAWSKVRAFLWIPFPSQLPRRTKGLARFAGVRGARERLPQCVGPLMGHLTKRKHQSMSAVTLLLIKAKKLIFQVTCINLKKQDKENRCCTLLSLPTQVHKKKLLLLTLPSHSTEGSSLVSSPNLSINLCHLFYEWHAASLASHDTPAALRAYAGPALAHLGAKWP